METSIQSEKEECPVLTMQNRIIAPYNNDKTGKISTNPFTQDTMNSQELTFPSAFH